MNNYVLGFRYNEEGVLLIRKQTPDWQKGLWNGLGGKVQPGETPVEAMGREFEEESGIVTVPFDWKHVITLTGFDYTLYVFGSNGHTDEHYHVCPEGILAMHKTIPPNIEQTADWLVRLVLDDSIPLAKGQINMPHMLGNSPLPNNDKRRHLGKCEQPVTAVTPITFSQYMTRVLKERPEELRPGQWAYTQLDRLRPRMAQMVSGTHLDPFYDDERLPIFFTTVQAMWRDLND